MKMKVGCGYFSGYYQFW